MTGPGSNTPADRERIEGQAIDWFVRMRGEPSVTQRAQFEAWYGAAAAHRDAYERAETHFLAAGLIDAPETTRTSTDRRQRLVIRCAVSASAAFAIAALALLAMPSLTDRLQGYLPVSPVQTPSLVLTSRPGEIRTISLTDGSRVTLDVASRAEVLGNQSDRRLRLTAGKMRVAVAAGEALFRIEAGQGMIETNDGVIDLSVDNDRLIRVDLVEGSARIGPSMRYASYVRFNRPILSGQPLAYGLDDFVPRPAPRDASDQRNWPLGWVSYSAIRLDRLVGQANRYARTPVVIDDPDLGRRIASGRFRLTDTKAFAGQVAQLLDLDVVAKPDAIHLKARQNILRAD